MVTIEIEPVRRFEKPGARIKRPKEIGHFTYDDENHAFRLDDSGIRYYYTPELGVSLSKGFETFKKLDDTADEHLDSLLKTIMALEKEAGKKLEADIVTWRGMMTRMLAAPYEPDRAFAMNATFFDGSIFVEEDHAFKLEGNRLAYQSSHRSSGLPPDLATFWGYKFETLCLLPSPWAETSRDFIEDRPNHTVCNYGQYCSIVQTGIGDCKLILAGEVDGIWDSRPMNDTDPINWVELKTSAEITSRRDEVMFDKKLLRIWAQSFLLGVPKIIVGFRSKDTSGILRDIQEITTTQIPRLVKERGHVNWDKDVAINFAATLLDLIKATITSDGIWKIRRHTHSNIVEIYKVEETGFGDILPLDFVQWRVELNKEGAKAHATNDLSEAQQDNTVNDANG